VYKRQGAETLKNNIDGGIYKECSISFVFSLPECSICGDDIRRCGHRPFKEYQTAEGDKSVAHFNYRQIEKVLETSIVYRGSVHDTSLTNELFFPVGEQSNTKNDFENFAPATINRIWGIEQLDTTHRYKVMPAYESLRIIIDSPNEELIARYYDDTKIVSQNLHKYLGSLSWPDGKYRLDCRLIGYRGKERQKLSELSKYLDGRKSNVTRIEIKVYDLLSSEDNGNELPDISGRQFSLKSMSGSLPGLLVPSETASKKKLTKIIENLSTRYGVEIADCQTDKKFLFTNKKGAFFNITSKEQISGGYKYRLSGKIGNIGVECNTPVTSRKNFPAGQSAEIEISTIKLTDGKIELTFPRIVDSIDQGTTNENLELLIHGNSVLKSNSTYTVSRYRNRDILLTIEKYKSKEHYIIKNFSLNRLAQKGRFLVDEVDTTRGQSETQLGRGQVLQSDWCEPSRKFRLNGFFDGLYAIRPIVHNHIKRFLFYEIPDRQTREADSVPQ